MEHIVGGVRFQIYPRARKRSVRCLICYQLGSRRAQVTFRGDLDAAKKHCKTLAKTVTSGEALDALHLTALDRRIYVLAKETAAPLGRAVDHLCRDAAAALRLLRPGVSLADAAAFWAKHHQAGAVRATVAEVAAALLTHMTALGRKRVTLAALRTIYHALGGSFPGVPLAELTTPDLQGWLGSHLAHSPRTQRNYRAALSRLFNFARRQGFLPGDAPTAAAHLDPVSKAASAGVEIFKPWEMTILLSRAPERLRPCLALGAFAGLRTAELVRLEWSAVRFPDEGEQPAHFPHGFIVVDEEAAKQHAAAARRIIPMSPNLLAWLLPCRFRTGRISPRRSDAKLSALITAEIATINAAEKRAHRPLLGRPKNGLRHSYGSYRLPVLNDIQALALEMNTSPRKIFANYRELTMPRDVEAWWQIAPAVPADIIQLELLG